MMGCPRLGTVSLILRDPCHWGPPRLHPAASADWAFRGRSAHRGVQPRRGDQWTPERPGSMSRAAGAWQSRLGIRLMSRTRWRATDAGCAVMRVAAGRRLRILERTLCRSRQSARCQPSGRLVDVVQASSRAERGRRLLRASGGRRAADDVSDSPSRRQTTGDRRDPPSVQAGWYRQRFWAIGTPSEAIEDRLNNSRQLRMCCWRP